MISCTDEGLETSGTLPELMADLCFIVDGLNKQLTKVLEEKYVKAFLMKAFDDGMAGLPGILAKDPDIIEDLLNKIESEEQ